MSKFEVMHYSANKEILKFNDFVSTSVIVSDEGIAVVNGKKVVPAGTIIAGKARPVLENRGEPVVKTNGSGAEGVLLNSVDVTYGPAAGAMVIHGFIDLTKLPEAPAAEAKTALSLIKFMN